MKLNLIDFDETIILFQSPNIFLLEILRVKPLRFKAFRVLLKYRKILNFFFGLNIKKIGVRLTRGISKNTFKEVALTFHKEYVKENLNQSILSIINNKPPSTINIIISGGFIDYIELFALENRIDKVIANEILFHGNRSLGKLISPDCVKYEKVKQLTSQYELDNFKEIIVYSDCMSDMPLFKIATKSFLVKKNEISIISKGTL